MGKKVDRFADRFEETRGTDNIAVVEDRFDNPDFSDDDIMRNLQMDFQNSHYVNLKHKPEDVVYQWGREIVSGKVDPEGIRERARLGWTPVPLSRHPEFKVMECVDGGENSRGGIIRSRGDILFERKVKYHDIAVRRSEAANFESLTAVSAMEKEIGLSPLAIGIKGNSMTMSRQKSFN